MSHGWEGQDTRKLNMQSKQLCRTMVNVCVKNDTVMKILCTFVSIHVVEVGLVEDIFINCANVEYGQCIKYEWIIELNSWRTIEKSLLYVSFKPHAICSIIICTCSHLIFINWVLSWQINWHTYYQISIRFGIMVFNATFNNSSAI